MPELFPQDQQKVDEFLHSNVNDVERKPFRPFFLLMIIAAVLAVMTVLAFWVATSHQVL